MWKKYKVWCLGEGSHAWLCFDHTQVSVDKARDRLMRFLDFIKLDMSYSNFYDHKSAIACFRIVFGFDLGIDIFIKQCIKGWKIERPPQPWHDPDKEGWDVGLIVQYSSTRPDNSRLDTAELGYKVVTLFAVLVYP